MEVTSFVGPAAVPQLIDASHVLAAACAFEDLDAHVLVPTYRQAQRAFEAGARHIAFVGSVSEWHNRANVRRSPAESADESARIVGSAPIGVRFRLNLATAFDCPASGRMAQSSALQLLESLVPLAPAMEIALCDTTGRANPMQVGDLFAAARSRFETITKWAFHGHDTYGLGAANAYAAWRAGATAIDASVGGLGGCPFAPGATGNVATEDLVWMFEQMHVSTGVDMRRLLEAAAIACAIPGAQAGGRVRDALRAAAARASVVA